ncbi:trace amine-associated receptor 1-like [Pimephales promelas]|nr:trace amine-associated receptor 1-like [Pimephales promelas]
MPGYGIDETGIDYGPVLCFESFNNSCVKFVYPSEIQILFYLFFSALALITVCGNLLVIIAIIHFKQLHTPTNYLLLSLAVADLLIGGFVMPPSILRSVETCCVSSIVTIIGNLLVIITVIHFKQLHTPTNYLILSLAVADLLVGGVVMPPSMLRSIETCCKMTSLATLVMIIISWTVSAALGFGMIFMKLNLLGIEDFYYENIDCDGACILQVQAIQSVNSELKKEGKATKTLAIVIGAFLTFWIPFFLCNLIDPFIGYSVPPLLFDLFLGHLAWGHLPGKVVLGSIVFLLVITSLLHKCDGWAKERELVRALLEHRGCASSHCQEGQSACSPTTERD